MAYERLKSWRLHLYLNFEKSEGRVRMKFQIT